jgi:hypothetical protein
LLPRLLLQSLRISENRQTVHLVCAHRNQPSGVVCIKLCETSILTSRHHLILDNSQRWFTQCRNEDCVATGDHFGRKLIQKQNLFLVPSYASRTTMFRLAANEASLLANSFKILILFAADESAFAYSFRFDLDREVSSSNPGG